MHVLSQGFESNRSGSFLESLVEQEAKQLGFHAVDFVMQMGNDDLFSPRLLIRNVPYISIYGTAAKSEFVIDDRMIGRRIRVECRWQQVSGSVDEKFPYLYRNAIEAMPENEIVFLLGGDGAKKEAINWFKRECSKESKKTLSVLSIPEFRMWIKALVRAA